MTKHCNGCFACRQTVLGQQVGDGTIRGVFLPQLNDDCLCRDQILELLWPARSKFRDRLADFGWVKRGHKLEWFEFELGNFLTSMRTRRCRDAHHSLPVCDCG
jgi:hypothetical protein